MKPFFLTRDHEQCRPELWVGDEPEWNDISDFWQSDSATSMGEIDVQDCRDTFGVEPPDAGQLRRVWITAMQVECVD